MAVNIKGITIELNGDTTKLDKALREVNKETRTDQSQLSERGGCGQKPGHILGL